MSETYLFPLRNIHPPADIPIDHMTDDQCLDVLVDAERVMAHQAARRVRAMARFAELRPPTRRVMDLADGAREEIAVELGMYPQTAHNQIAEARSMVARLPETVQALSDGVIDYRRALAMSDLTHLLSEEDALKVERRVLERGRRANPGKFRDAIRREAIKADPEAAAKRRAAAKKHRDVNIDVAPDGMGYLNATLNAEDSIAARDRIDLLARRVKTPDQSLGECRAAVLVDLILGKEHEQVTTHINVTVAMTTLLGLNENPGELSGYGAITAEHARELAQNATWRRIITDDTGKLLETNRKRHLSPDLIDYIKMRDRSCRQPGCSVRAERSEIDHTIRREHHGVNSPDNTAALCRFHNLMRERSDWNLEQPMEGTLVFTSPAGRSYVTTPEPYEPAPF
jgi:hypothetical protein